MPKLLSATLFFIIVVLYFEPVKSIKCYVCRSDVDSRCSEKPDESLLKECPKTPRSLSSGYCRKIEQQLYFKNENEVTIIRECAYEKNPNGCYKSRWKESVYQKTCECEGDSCNRSSQHPPPGTLPIIVLIVVAIRYRFPV